MYKITAIPALKNNYFWLVTKGQLALLIDPGDAKPCLDLLQTQSLRLDTIWITHHHQDHIAGIQTLVEIYQCPVYGPNDIRIPKITHTLISNSRITWQNYQFLAIELRGHTNTHLIYWDEMNKILFCGDIIFAAGCGRNMEGKISDLYHSLQFITKFPKETSIFCAHEYTLENLKFALEVEPDNEKIQKRYEAILRLRKENTPSIPTQLNIELETNPFLRSHLTSIRARLDKIAMQPNIQQALESHQITNQDEYYFAVLRLWKNTYV